MGEKMRNPSSLSETSISNRSFDERTTPYLVIEQDLSGLEEPAP